MADRKQGAGWISGSSAAVHEANWTQYMHDTCTKQADPLFHVDKTIKLRTNNGKKWNQETFRTD